MAKRLHKGRTLIVAIVFNIALYVVDGGVNRASAISVNLNTTSLNGTAGRLDFQLLDGDLTANNSASISALATNGTFQGRDCSLGCSGGPPFVINDALGLGEFIQDLVLGTAVSFNFITTSNFAGGSPDLLVLNLLDPSTNFSLVNTNLDALSSPVPFQDALFTFNFATGQLVTASISTPLLPINVSAVPEPEGLLLTGAALILLAKGMRRALDLK